MPKASDSKLILLPCFLLFLSKLLFLLIIQIYFLSYYLRNCGAYNIYSNERGTMKVYGKRVQWGCNEGTVGYSEGTMRVQ